MPQKFHHIAAGPFGIYHHDSDSGPKDLFEHGDHVVGE
jgi:hypothetical protein